MNQFQNKAVLVTGATAGIGRATAEAFAAEGARLILTGRNSAAGEDLAATLRAGGATAHFVAADVSLEDGARRAVAAAVERFGGLDVAVNNAGFEGETGPLTGQSDDNYARIFDTNVKGMWLALKHQIPALAKRGGGAIVNLSSVVGEVGMPGAALYTASKHAVNGLTRAAALEVARQNIRINAVAPGVIGTEMLQRFTGGSRQAQEGLAAAHPVGRIGKPEEVAQAILYLAGDGARFVTGTILTVDGGWTAQ